MALAAAAAIATGGVAASMALAGPGGAEGPGAPVFRAIGTYDTGIALEPGETTAGETSAFAAGRLYVTNSETNSLDVVDASDPTVLGVTALTIAAAAMGACLIPAWRATRYDPLESLRVE